MYLCTCNNCGNVWIDTNSDPKENVEYPNDLTLKELCIIKDMKACCICKTDAYLVDNLNENAGGMAAEITKMFDGCGKAGHSIFEVDWSGERFDYQPLTHGIE